MNAENALLKEYFLNDVNITSSIRAPGEFKYFYMGENSSETDKSFLYFSSLWHSEKVTKDMEIICSCYNNINTGQLFYNKKTQNYNLFIYKNIIDYRNENISLKLHRIINITPKKRLDVGNKSQKNQNDKEYQNIMNSKIYLASKEYILLNEVDLRILLINIDTGRFITIFSKSYEEKEILYNIFDTYDETFIINGKQRIRTYTFLSLKYQDRKNTTYKYTYFILQNFIEKKIHLYPINLDLGNSEPIGIKVAKIIHKDEYYNEQKCFFIICFLSTTISLQFITNYDNVTLHQMFQKYSKITGKESQNREHNPKLLNYWINRTDIKIEKIQFSQGINLFLNVNNKKICALIYYFETQGIISYVFNYTDTPEAISKKIFLKQKELNLNNEIDVIKRNDINVKTYTFLDCYLFKKKSIFGYSDKNLIIFEKNFIYMYEPNLEHPVFTYEFYDETLSALMTFENIGYAYILTDKKLFKIIKNVRYKPYDNDILFSKNIIHYYKYNYTKKTNISENLSYPLFEYKPEDIWNAYCNNLNIKPIVFEEESFLSNSFDNDNDEEVFEPKITDKKLNLNLENYEGVCALCNVKCSLKCSHCGARYYCCYEHFRYDYFNFHFFECQLIQFFQRKDIMQIKNLEIRYKVLYNELIKMSGRILNFIFTRIFSKKDYPYFLNMILTLINIFINFGFLINLSDFCSFNMNGDKKKFRHEKCIFYLESLFYFVQLNLLKCTFTLRGGLYNLTDCYIKMFKCDIVPKLTPKMNNRINIKMDKVKSDMIYGNQYFSEFNSPLFFDLKRYTKYLVNTELIDLIQEYIIYHLKSISLIAKFKIKIHSSIEVHNMLIDIILMFDDHYTENSIYKNIVPYCYFSVSFYLVEIGKIIQTVKLLRRMVGDNFEVHLKKKLYALTYYNLGLLQYASGYFELGIHNIEIAYKLVLLNNYSDKLKFQIIDSLGLAYLNRNNLYKAYILIQTSIKERKKVNREKYLLKCNKLNVYLNYIIDLYEYSYISKARVLIENKYRNYDRNKLIKFIMGDEDEELIISEQNLVQFIKVVEFIWKLDEQALKTLNSDNPPKAPSYNREEVIHHDKSFSFNSDISQVYNNNLNEKNDIEEYEEDIEVKVNLYDTFSRQQQNEFKELKTIYLKRDIVLRDSLGFIEKFNINYEPIFADEFQKIIEKLKVNFLLKDIFYCFQNEKWRDELYNYNQNNILFGLSKYLKLEKIQNMMAIEKSKNIEIRNKEKAEIKAKNNLYEIESYEDDDESSIENVANQNNNIKVDAWLSPIKENEESFENRNSDMYIREFNFNKELANMSGKQKNKLHQKNKNMSYQKFKNKFISALKLHEKGSKDNDLLAFMNLDEDYLYVLYKNVYQNNPDKDFIFKNPLLVLNYIFLEINKTDEDNNTPVIGKNNKIIKNVISNVKEEVEEYSMESKNNKEEKNINSEESESMEDTDEIKTNKFKKNQTNKNINNLEQKSEIKDNEIKSIKKYEEKRQENSFSDDSMTFTLDSFSKKEKQVFSIISQEAKYIYIPNKLSNAKSLDKRNELKRGNPLKNLIFYQKFGKFNIVEVAQKKQNSAFMKQDKKNKSFIDGMDSYFNSTKIKYEKDEDNNKNFELIKKKNRKLSSKNNSSSTNHLLGRRIKKAQMNKDKQRKKNFLLASIKNQKLWKNDKQKDEEKKDILIKNKKNNFKKLGVQTNIQKNDNSLMNQLMKDVDSLIKKETNKTYLRHAKIRQIQNNIKNNNLKNKDDIEKEALKFLKYVNKKKITPEKQENFNYNEINKYMNNNKCNYYNKKEKEINSKLTKNSYINAKYRKIDAKSKIISKEKINKNINKSFDEERAKILRYNGKLINRKYIFDQSDIQDNNYNNTFREGYFNIELNNNKKNRFEENSNIRNFILENNSYVNNNLNGVNNSYNYKKIINRNILNLSETNTNKNIKENTSRLIQKYKLFPFLKKNGLFRSKESSLLNTLPNTNTQTPRNKNNISSNKKKEAKIKKYINNFK